MPRPRRIATGQYHSKCLLAFIVSYSNCNASFLGENEERRSTTSKTQTPTTMLPISRRYPNEAIDAPTPPAIIPRFGFDAWSAVPNRFPTRRHRRHRKRFPANGQLALSDDFPHALPNSWRLDELTRAPTRRLSADQTQTKLR